MLNTIYGAREVCLLFLSRKAGIAARYDIYAVKLIFINPVKNIPKQSINQKLNLPKIHQKTIKAKCLPTIGTTPGKSGNNYLNGGANDDIIYAGTGVDNIDGGADTDTLRFDGGTQRVVVNLGSNSLIYDGGSSLNANSFVNSHLNGGSRLYNR